MKNFFALLSVCAPVFFSDARAAGPALFASLTNPVSVVFNNAYKGLVEDNEKICRADPHAPDKYFLSFIASAKKSLDVCVYDVSEPGAVAALLDAKSRGVNVRVVTESANTVYKEQGGRPRESILQFQAAQIPVVADNRQGLMHCKFIVADGAAVWFGSMNLTVGSIYRDNNNSLFVRSPELAAVFETEFKQLFEKNEFDHGAVGTTQPIRVGDTEFTVRFSPGGGAQAALLDAIRRATNSARFMIFTFTDREVGNLLAKKKQAGLTVEGVFDECQIDYLSEFRWLGKQGVKTWPDGNQALLHHKVMLLDDDTVCCGSYNFTRSAEGKNNEVLVVLRSRRIAAAYRAEFDRLVFAAEHNPPLPPYDSPACDHKQNSRAANKPVPR